MGSMIHLAVGRLEIDWGKNSSFADHSPLFQKDDLSLVPYYYVKEGDNTYIDSTGNERYELIVELKDGASKPLGQVADRISLLGHTLEHCEKEFEYLAGLNGFDTELFQFAELREALTKIDVNSISADYGEMGEDFGDFFRRQLFDRLNLSEIAANPEYARYQIGEAMENLSAYSILQLLALNPKTHKLPVTWQFADAEEGGWAKRQEFMRPLDQCNRFLIVTEGSSDAKIIRHAFHLLKPHIADFFDFVDMEEGYPFAGTGNLYRFLQGLISISLQNNVIIIYDNDAEGLLNLDRSHGLNVPDNMKILRLPDRLAFNDFETTGPNGRHRANINGRAAAIECYLDLGEDSLVRWSNYNIKSDNYQGELINKTKYMKIFLDQRQQSNSYNYSHLEAILDMIIRNCVQMREAVIDQRLRTI